MTQFDFKKTSRRCSVTDREFESGEEFYSALVDVEGKLERVDFATDSWESAPENCVGWWTSRMPNLDQGKIYWAPNHVLFSYFEHAYENRGTQPETAYVVAILMVQKRILQMIETDESTEPPTLILHYRKTKTDFHLPTVELTPQRMLEIQEQLSENLFTSSLPTDSDPDEGNE